MKTESAAMEYFFYLLFVALCLVELHCRYLIDEPSCNISTHCTSQPINNGIDALECIQNLKVVDVNRKCIDVIREQAKHYFTDESVQKAIQVQCPADFSVECENKNQKFIFCILQQKDKIENIYCQNFVKKMEYIITADFSLVSDFKITCENEISEFKCNNLDINSQMVLWDNALDCLQKNIDSIKSSACRQEVYRLSEIQGEDMKLDTQLYLLCSTDRLKFCSHLDVNANFEMVYKCLLAHISDTIISPSCQEQLLKREKLITKDVNVSKGLVKACRADIRLYRCRRLVSEDKAIRLAQMLMCLENAARNGTKVTQECRSEIMQHRKLLMEDYRLSPEVVSHCSNDIEEYCNGLKIGSRTIHCLMEHSRPLRKMHRVSPPCQKALQSLITVVDAGEDWRVDSVIHEACKTAVNRLCSDIPGGDSRVMSCLLDNIGNRHLNPSCELALVELQYFVSRDFKLDPQLYSACYYDAMKFCDNVEKLKHESDIERSKFTLPCLFRHMNAENSNLKLRQVCVEEVKRVMRLRAISVELMPEVEMACIDDLALYCNDKTGHGEEMVCLQDNFLKLGPDCKFAVGNFTEAEVGNIDLNPVVRDHCSTAITTHCQENAVDGADNIMDCLIKHKNDADMKSDYKCRAVIEHFQLITLNDYHFTVAFKEACHPYVTRHCPKVHTKAQVVECLSVVIRNDTITEQRYKIPKECRYQLRAQLLQQRELVDLDPKLKSQCEADILKFCKNVHRGSSRILECLGDNIKKLSIKCHKVVFRIQQHDMTDSSSDYTLLTNCKNTIKEYCENTDLSDAFICLKKYKDYPAFDDKCRAIVNKRIIEQSLDYRLNPHLKNACAQDIIKYCMPVVRNQPPDIEFQGKVIKCLKVKFREQKLKKECEKQVSVKLKEEALNYKLNPLLRDLCVNEIHNLCRSATLAEETGNSGTVEECLKVAFVEGQIIDRACRLEVAGLIEETRADINVDPLLHQACMNDISKYCTYVTPGSGRILQCLQNVIRAGKITLQKDCDFKLNQRIQMFRNADALVADAPRNLEDVIQGIVTSPSCQYILLLVGCIVCFIFFSGLICGKITHRSHILKNK